MVRIDLPLYIQHLCAVSKNQFMRTTIKYSAMLVFASLVLVACSRSKENETSVKKTSNAVILQWNEIAYDAFGGPAYQHSLMASRINAMTHLAIHDAINAIEPVYASYIFEGSDAAADPIAAAAAAAHTVLARELPARKEFLDSALEKSLSSIVNTVAKEKGLELGRKAGLAIINARSNDGSAGDPFKQIRSSTTPGVYQPVPPFNIQFAPYWENVFLFGLRSKDQFRPAPPPALNTDKYKVAFDEVKTIGKMSSTTRSTDQSSYAKFWYEFSEAGWNRITRVVVREKGLSLVEAARLFALVNIALADAYIAGWDAKLHYNFWRPYTAIRNAANDGNDATIPDKNWQPSEPTPPIHDYPSTHSALGNAAATVLAELLGDKTSFTFSSLTAIPSASTRSFTSFMQAADENASSRVMAGIHFRFSCDAGQQLGNEIGDWIVNNKLQPLK
jgi:hypothetical protein